MLAYLDALIAALSVRDATEGERLLAHPLARVLPDAAREEARRFITGQCDPLSAPMRVMRLRHQTAELLRDAPEAVTVADRAESAPAADRVEAALPGLVRPPSLERRGRLVQMELPLSA